MLCIRYLEKSDVNTFQLFLHELATVINRLERGMVICLNIKHQICRAKVDISNAGFDQSTYVQDRF